MAESFAFNIVENVLVKLATEAYREISRAWGVQSDFQRLNDLLTTVKDVLLDAEGKQANNNQLRNWLQKLKDACYDAEDVLDEFEFEALRRQVLNQRSIGSKTAIAKLVFNDECVDRRFELKMSVCVSDDFDLKRLMIKMIKAAKGVDGDCSPMDLEQLQKALRDCLNGKKYLLILDDVWNEDNMKWNELKRPSVGGSRGSKIVVTTRSNQSAKMMGTIPTRTLQGLPEEESLSLFLRHLGAYSSLNLQNMIGNKLEIVRFFRKDYEFLDVGLIQFWMAHVLLQSSDENEDLKDIGRLAKSECSLVNSSRQNIPQGVRHLCLDNLDSLEENPFRFLDIDKLCHVGTFCFRHIKKGPNSEFFIKKCLSGFHSLRVLDLEGSNFELHNLETLLIRCEGIEELPKDMRYMISLRMLMVPRQMPCLNYLEIEECPILRERCKAKKGKDWAKIAHVSNIWIDGNRISSSISNDHLKVRKAIALDLTFTRWADLGSPMCSWFGTYQYHDARVVL
ncbi:hypothetical protein PTKIN_Ptkin01aG0298600 [Pterospermum kingtungense]